MFRTTGEEGDRQQGVPNQRGSVIVGIIVIIGTYLGMFRWIKMKERGWEGKGNMRANGEIGKQKISRK